MKDFDIEELSHSPVSLGICAILIIVYVYFNFSKSTIPCGKNIKEVFLTNFIHVDPVHLFINLYTFYIFFRIEKIIGSKHFTILIVYLLIFNSILEFLFRFFYPNVKCSIGFSGVIFGLITWELINEKSFDIYLILYIVLLVITPSLKNSNASLYGHIIGALGGILGGYMWKYVK